MQRPIGVVALVLSLSFGAALAQSPPYPNHPVKILIGPSPDIFARIVGEHLQQVWGQPVVVEPRPGAGGKLAVQAVSTAAPDGYTMLFATPTYTLNTAMKTASYDLLKEFEPVAIIGLISYALVINPNVPVHSVKELVDYAKANPGKLNCASAGIGTVPHLACEFLNKVAGVNIVHVPYRDVNSGTMATVAGTTQLFFGVSTSAKSQIDAGTLRGIAVSTRQRSLLLPNLPTMVELGYPAFDMPGWGGLIATPAPQGRGRQDQCRGAACGDAARAAEAADQCWHGAAAGIRSGAGPPIHPGRYRALDEVRERSRSGTSCATVRLRNRHDVRNLFLTLQVVAAAVLFTGPASAQAWRRARPGPGRHAARARGHHRGAAAGCAERSDLQGTRLRSRRQHLVLAGRAQGPAGRGRAAA